LAMFRGFGEIGPNMGVAAVGGRGPEPPHINMSCKVFTN